MSNTDIFPISHLFAYPKEYCEQEICRDDPQSVIVQVLGEGKFISGPFFHRKLINVDQRRPLCNMGYIMVCSNPDNKCNWMNMKPLLREIYQACKYFLVSEIPRILLRHLSSRQMCVGVSCCGRVSRQSVQEGDGPEAHSWDKIMSAPFLRTAESFSSPLSLHLTLL